MEVWVLQAETGQRCLLEVEEGVGAAGRLRADVAKSFGMRAEMFELRVGPAVLTDEDVWGLETGSEVVAAPSVRGTACARLATRGLTASKALLQQAVASGDIDVLRLCLDAGITPQSNIAAEAVTPNIVQELLERGAQVSPDAVAAAVTTAPITVLQALVQAQGVPAGALHAACWAARLNAARLLLCSGASPDEKLSEGHHQSTPLLAGFAGSEGEVAAVPIVSLLLSKGASALLANTAGMTPLHAATWRGWASAARLLLKAGAVTEAADREGRTPMHIAATHADSCVLLALLQYGASVSAVDVASWTPLHCAVNASAENAVNVLLQHGADVNVCNADGETPLLVAVVKGREEITMALLSGGADVRVTDEDGWSALHLACFNGKAGIVRLLIGSGADVNKRTPTGLAPFDAAVCPEIQDLLLKAGAEPCHSDSGAEDSDDSL